MARPSHHGTLAVPIVVSLALFSVAGCSSNDGAVSAYNEGGAPPASSADDDDDSGNPSGVGGNSLAPTGGSGDHVATDSGGTHSGGRTSQAGTAQGGSPRPSGSGGASTSVGAAGSDGIQPDPSWAGAGQVPITTDKGIDCGGNGCQCNNGIDDDGDGQIDGFDTECVGPYDDDESTFATGIPGDNSDPKWQDCFFDGNSGAGDDGCRYSTQCLTGGLEPSDPDCTVTQACIEYCAPMTPNGCDCFGCCSVTDSEGVEHFVYVNGSCSEEKLDDPDVCIACTPSEQCGNECGECELCPGMSPEDLPASCAAPPDGAGGAGGTPGAAGAGNTPGAAGAAGATPEPPIYRCDNGMPVCALDMPCNDSQYCMNGCCMWMAL